MRGDEVTAWLISNMTENLRNGFMSYSEMRDKYG